MTNISAFDDLAPARAPADAGKAVPAAKRARVVLLQTQAEAAGAQEVSRILGRGLQARGYDVHTIFLFRRTSAFDQQANTHFCMAERRTGPLALGRMMRSLVRQLRALRPDAILCFQHYGTLVGALAGRLAGVNAVIANRTSAKSLVPHWAYYLDLAFGCGGAFDKVVVNSRAVETEYLAYPRAYRSRVTRIDHGFESKSSLLGATEARRSLSLPVHATLLGTVARLHPTKNLAAAIRLLPFEQKWQLAIAGQGPDRENLVALATALGVARRVHFVGELSPEQVSAFLRSIDVFVFPTLAETFGLAAVEAAQAGVPVVANDLEVLREVLAIDGEPCALLLDAADVGAFANAVRRVLSDDALRTRLCGLGQKLSSKYSLDAMVDEYASLIDQLA